MSPVMKTLKDLGKGSNEQLSAYFKHKSPGQLAELARPRPIKRRHPNRPTGTINVGDDAARLRWSRLHGPSQDEEEHGGVVNRGPRDERSSAIKEAPSDNAQAPGHAYWASHRVLVGKGRVSFRDVAETRLVATMCCAAWRENKEAPSTNS
jgi:hypothetical protein